MKIKVNGCLNCPFVSQYKQNSKNGIVWVECNISGYLEIDLDKDFKKPNNCQLKKEHINVELEAGENEN